MLNDYQDSYTLPKRVKSLLSTSGIFSYSTLWKSSRKPDAVVFSKQEALRQFLPFKETGSVLKWGLRLLNSGPSVFISAAICYEFESFGD